ncbi:DNA polymerase III subunit alpha [Gammaproteobacteria bacterium]|nr:DNA polymerase III subunit alpha [Gammaproteobacteria bacterium]MDA9112888.1 DNA polymerase III subunit alpha [Gammaproteobacteria bacterium]MDB9861690.1 DNA polymerase III subunit alpha [Gammaproteobacteria bacterium]MDC1191047.1 DNA polymerase III subunit alpha [Gammaproteobacteria bacterium]
MIKSFSHLRVASEYSISHGLITIDQIVDQAVKNNMPSVALTDNLNMFGLVKFFIKAEKKGIKPISGSSINVIFEDDDFAHELLCLAKNNNGHKNLMKILSQSHNNIHFPSPIITFEELCLLKNDIKVISGGKSSHIFDLLKRGKVEDTKTKLETFQSAFGEDFVIEVQKTNRADELDYISHVLPLASEKGIPVIATNDVIFSNKEDYDIHETKVCINTGKTLNDPNREKKFSNEQFFKSQEQMSELFNNCDEFLSNTAEIAKQCNVSFDSKGYFLPEYPVPKNHDFNSFLSDLSFKNLNNLIKDFDADKKAVYQDRLNYELTQISTMGFSSYFLIVYDFIEWSKNNDVPVGPGRGSGAGSLVAYSLGITALDPIEHGLLFERFLNPERISMPDFDIDFCTEKRDLVIDYVSTKYGSNAVSQIVTFGTMAARAVVKDVTRALGKPYGLGERISKMIPFVPGMTLDRAIKEQPIFKQTIKDDPEVSEVLELAFKLEGIARNVGKHAGGIVIAPGALSDFCPTYLDRQSSALMTQYDKDDVEKIGLVKFDFLGLRTLTVIDWATKSINKYLKDQSKTPLDIHSLKLDDPKVFELLSSGKTMAVFQLESSGMRDLIKRLKPTKFEDITALLALYRPGPLDSKMDDQFVDRKHGKIPVTYPHELLEPVLSETYGVILYQEQVMQAAQVLAGFSLGQADILRRAMGKKDVVEMETQREIFVEGCDKKDIKKSTAEKIFDLIEKFAGYGFNKSHSAAYALLSYQTAYLKTYYPEHFMAAVLSTELGNTDKIYALTEECKKLDITVLKPNILLGEKKFIVNKNKEIEYGLGGIKGVADSFITHVSKIRETHEFKDLWDFTRNVDIKLGGKKSLEALSFCGAFDSIAPSRSTAIACITDMLQDGGKATSSASSSGDLFASIELDFDPYQKYTNIKELPLVEKLNLEKKSLGYYLSGHPVKAIKENIRPLRSHEISNLKIDTKKARLVCLINSVRQIKDNRNKPLTFINFDDGTGAMDGIITSEILENCYSILKESSMLVLKGAIEMDDYRSKEFGETMFRMRIKEVSLIEDELVSKVKKITIRADNNSDESISKLTNNLMKVPHEVWGNGNCSIQLKVFNNESEAIIELGDEYLLRPTQENLDLLRDLFGQDSIEI